MLPYGFNLEGKVKKRFQTAVEVGYVRYKNGSMCERSQDRLLSEWCRYCEDRRHPRVEVAEGTTRATVTFYAPDGDGLTDVGVVEMKRLFKSGRVVQRDSYEIFQSKEVGVVKVAMQDADLMARGIIDVFADHLAPHHSYPPGYREARQKERDEKYSRPR